MGGVLGWDKRTAGGTFKKLVYSPILEIIKTHLLQGTGVEAKRLEDSGRLMESLGKLAAQQIPV